MATIIGGAGIALVLFSCKTPTPTEELSARDNNRSESALSTDKKYGLSQAERKQISEEIFQLWVKAGNLSAQKYPLIQRGERVDREKMMERVRKQAEMQQSLLEEYLNELAKKYSLSQEQLTDIINEGIDKQWTNYPKPPPEYR